VTQFVVNPYRHDPYKNFKFRVIWDGREIAGISKISCLKRATVPTIHRGGTDPRSSSHLSPGNWKFEPVTLERGVTHDTAFEEWADLSFRYGGDMSLKHFRKDIVIELLNEQGTVAKRYLVHNCWVSEYQVLPDLDANANSVAIETITLENEGWERDKDTKEPEET
jgi:phage tail-like protein